MMFQEWVPQMVMEGDLLIFHIRTLVGNYKDTFIYTALDNKVLKISFYIMITWTICAPDFKIIKLL